MDDVVLRVRDLTVRYATSRGRVAAVQGVSFDVARGEVFGLVGESGSGKSSVLTAVMRMLPASARVSAESLAFEGRDLLRLKESELRSIRGDQIALIPQRPMTSLSPTTPIGRQLEWYFGHALQDPDTQTTLGRIGLRTVLSRLDDLPGRFSGGQLQRLLIAIAALTHRPALLLADEPTTTLDATVQAQVLNLLARVRETVGSAILYVSHDLAVIAQVCDRVGVMYGGRLVEVGPTAEVFNDPQHPYTRALLDAMPSRWDPERGLLGGLPGSAAGANRAPGCPFAPRCALADERCHTTMPEVSLTARGMVRCHKVGVAA